MTKHTPQKWKTPNFLLNEQNIAQENFAQFLSFLFLTNKKEQSFGIRYVINHIPYFGRHVRYAVKREEPGPNVVLKKALT